MHQTDVSSVLSFGAKTDRGNHRDHNEDSYFADPALKLWIVADGMGGHLNGEVASAIAVDQVAVALRAGAMLADAIFEAHESVLQASGASGSQGDRAQMGTTIVALRLDQDNLGFEVAWVGDSRAYLWAPRAGMKLLTRDHTVVQELIDGGAITTEQARTHPHRNAITRALGGTRMRREDIERVSGRLRAGERILLCSDGLHKELEDTEIEKILGEPATDAQRAQHLVDAVITRNGDDNITAVLISAPPGAASRRVPLHWIISRQRTRYVALLLVVAFLGGLTTYVIHGRDNTHEKGPTSAGDSVSR